MNLGLLDGLKQLLRGEEKKEEEPRPGAQEIDMSAARRSISKRKNEMKRRRRERLGDAPGGEELSLPLTNAQLIEIAFIKEDPTFVNTRVHEDALRPELHTNEGQKLEDLEASMRDEGLKVPIIVVEGPRCYFLRAGFRRSKIARKLGWKKIPAIVFPADTPQKDEYWINILENATRKQLSTYESARAAQLMRDKFGVTAAEFSRKAGYSESHVSKLLTCIDKLPEQLIEQWRMGAGLSFDEWYQLALMDPEHAMRRFWSLTGQRPKEVLKELTERGKGGKKIPPAWLADRMMRLYEGIEGGELEPRTRSLVLRAIEICMCTRDFIKGVYEPRRQGEYSKRARLRAELKLPELPEPGEEAEVRPPMHLDSEENSEEEGPLMTKY